MFLCFSVSWFSSFKVFVFSFFYAPPVVLARPSWADHRMRFSGEEHRSKKGDVIDSGGRLYLSIITTLWWSQTWNCVCPAWLLLCMDESAALSSSARNVSRTWLPCHRFWRGIRDTDQEVSFIVAYPWNSFYLLTSCWQGGRAMHTFWSCFFFKNVHAYVICSFVLDTEIEAKEYSKRNV